MVTRILLVALLVAGSTLAAPNKNLAQAATCQGSVGPGISPPAQVPSGIPGFHAHWYGQSGYQTLCPGERSTATVAYYNTGSFGWVKGKMGEVAYLGTWNAVPGQDQPSKLGGDGTSGSPATGWPRYNRIAIQPAPYVGPGQVAWFQFAIQAPMVPGVYKLYLRPMIEGATWMEDFGVYWVVTVLNPDGSPPPPPPLDPELGCREWPMELGYMMSKLPLPSQLCLLPYDQRPELCPFPMLGCYVGVGVYGPERFVWTRNVAWVAGSSGFPSFEREVYATAHEICHAHQHRVSSDAGFSFWSLWDITPRAAEFKLAWDLFKTNFPQGYAAWGDRGQLLENNADVCAGWYYPSAASRTASYPPLANWAQKWLP